ncbi:MAG: hypothetical protein LBD41_02280 [Clostridiales Family XIII bacterium]|jgi:uncharacterized protein YacL|nr:hypothetical protein [Clostridiales Family XIII bacterium]
MFKNLIRIAISIASFFVGYGLFILFKNVSGDLHLISLARLNAFQNYGGGWLIAAIFAILAFLFFPITSRVNKNISKKINKDLEKKSSSDILGGAAGLILGLIIAYLLSRVWMILENSYLAFSFTVITFIIFAYIGATIGMQRGTSFLSGITSFRHEGQQKQAIGTRHIRDKILDTSVLIDGRIYDILKTGFLEGRIIIPEFVILELQYIADSADSLKRNKGRNGLDTVKKMQEKYGIEIYNVKNKKLDEFSEVDIKLIKLAEGLNANLVTNDYNLNKVASISGIFVLNINELTDILRPRYIAGEKIRVLPLKEGENRNQAIAYLDDGTMIVVENGKDYIGKNINVTVSSTLQSSAGRMIFAKKE